MITPYYKTEKATLYEGNCITEVKYCKLLAGSLYGLLMDVVGGQ